MRRNEIDFPHDTRDSYIRRCMNNSFNTNQETVDRIAAESCSTEDFIERYLSEGDRNEQFYQVLLMYERPERAWKYVREIFGDRQFKTVSDIGGVLIGNPQFSVLIKNGRGDGTTRVAIFESKDDFRPIEDIMRYQISFTGQDIGIYGYDYDDPAQIDPIKKISGSFAAYSYEGLVAFVRR